MSEPDYNLGIMGIKWSSQEIGTLLSGAAGSLIYMRFLGKMPWYERLTLIVFGAVVSYYIGPWATVVLDMQKFAGMIGFLTGVFGMATLNAGLSILSAIGANPLEWLRVALAKVKQ